MTTDVTILWIDPSTLIEQLSDVEWWSTAKGCSRQEWLAAQARESPVVRLRHLAGRLLARHALAKISGHAPQSINLETDTNGKPFMADARGKPTPFHLSISHTSGLVAAAASHCEVGIDLEQVKRRANWQAIAQSYFFKDEANWVTRNPKVSSKRFLALWTLKEAYLKAMGSAASLNSMTFQHLGARRFLGVHPNRPSSLCKFVGFRPGYLVAVSHLLTQSEMVAYETKLPDVRVTQFRFVP